MKTKNNENNQLSIIYHQFSRVMILDNFKNLQLTIST